MENNLSKPPFNAHVFRVVDGDTFMGLVRFRIVGYNAAELDTTEGKELKNKLREAIARKKVQLRFVAVDAFGRMVVEVLGFNHLDYSYSPPQ
jgi:endonuclease YncB( thermonuclease family)